MMMPSAPLRSIKGTHSIDYRLDISVSRTAERQILPNGGPRLW